MVWKCWENCSSACAGSAPAGHPPRRSDEAAPRRQAGQFVALPGFWLSCVTQRVFDSWQSDWWLLGPRPLRTDHVSLALQDARVGPAWSYQGHARYDGASDNSPHRAACEAALSDWSQEVDMDDLIGFHVGVWDYITFLALIVIAVIAFRIARLHARPGPLRSARGSRRRWRSRSRAGASSVRRE